MTRALTTLGVTSTAACVLTGSPWWVLLSLAVIHAGAVVLAALATVALQEQAVQAAGRATQPARGT